MADIDVHYDPITLHTDPTTVEIKGLDDNQTTLTLATPQPLKTESKAALAITEPVRLDSRSEIVIPQPIRTETQAALDIKPLVFDQCLTIRLGPLPPTCVQQPYHVDVGWRLFGVEIVGFTVAGESQVLVSEPASKPYVAWGAEQTRPQPAARSAAAPGAQPAQTQPSAEPTGGGLRIRIGG